MGVCSGLDWDQQLNALGAPLWRLEVSKDKEARKMDDRGRYNNTILLIGTCTTVLLIFMAISTSLIMKEQSKAWEKLDRIEKKMVEGTK